jgi:phosphoribosylformylglycinamidine synthase
MGALEDARKLYSESNTRWIAEVKPENAKAFESALGGKAVCIGETGGDKLNVASAGISLSVKEMRKAWNDPIWNIMGGSQ